MDRIFEPYFTTREGGTGLGLALTHKILEEHGGTIRVESQVGSGATFIITLPLVGAS
jgi:signal transduction histidine kinase